MAMGAEAKGAFPLLRSDFADEMTVVADMMLKHMQSHFTSSGEGKWKSLWGGGASHLTKSGKLKNSLHKKSTKDTASVWGGEGIKYAHIHQWGGVIRKTDKSRAFFMYMYTKGDKGNPMWLRLATSKKDVTRMPQRKWIYFAPGFLNTIKAFLQKSVSKVQLQTTNPVKLKQK